MLYISMKQKLLFFFLFLCFSTFLNAQPQNDSLAKYSYEELRNLYKKNKPNDSIYVREYLERGKKDKDSIKIARGYYNMAVELENSKDRIKYIDSSIITCKNCKHSIYPALSYYLKGYYLYLAGENREALNVFFKALEVLKKNKNIELEINTRNSIISVKSNWGTNEENLYFTLDFIKFIESQRNYKVLYQYDYQLAIYNLAITYIKLQNYDKAFETIKLGITEIKGIDNYDFVSLAGITQYYLENYKTAIDSLQKALPYRDDHGKAMSNYYLAKSYDKLSQPEKAQFHFLKTDSIYQVTKDVFPEMRIAYEHIIEYYKSKNDTENQIKYYDRLIETDKIIDSTYTYVTETVQKKYETPQAIAERNRLLEEAKEKQNAWKYNFGIISAILVAILGILVFVFRRQRYYKKRFESLMKLTDSDTENAKLVKTSIERSRNTLNMTSEKQKQEQKEIDIPEAIIENILEKLSKFEASKGFTKQVTLAQLAKKLGTNQKYLSKVINWHYKKSYSVYINDLRVHYAISKLKEETTFRNYTIKAIAEEVGFRNATAFSKAFYKTTGINPSYFIKELQKR